MASSDPFPDDTVEAFEQTLCQVRTVHVFKIPPRLTSGGYRAGDWKEEVWQGGLKVVQKGMDAAVLLIDPKTNALFAMCPVKEGSVERCVDSSRYYVLKIQNAQGRHAFIGVAFNEREEAFDFNVALQEYEKDKKREEKLRNGTLEQEGAALPKLDLSLKEGQKISIKLPSRASADGAEGGPAPAARGSRRTAAASSSAGLGGGLLPPPPGSGGSLLAPPPSAPSSAAASRKATSPSLVDPFSSSTDTAAVSSSFFVAFGTANAQPGSTSSSGFSGFDAFDPLVATPVGGNNNSGSSHIGSSSSWGSKAAAPFGPLDDWAGVSASLPSPSQQQQRQQGSGGAMKPSSSADPFAGLLDL